jgi:hypothetical protein
MYLFTMTIDTLLMMFMMKIRTVPTAPNATIYLIDVAGYPN